jgi:hypothetical protein
MRSGLRIRKVLTLYRYEIGYRSSFFLRDEDDFFEVSGIKRGERTKNKFVIYTSSSCHEIQTTFFYKGKISMGLLNIVIGISRPGQGIL